MFYYVKGILAYCDPNCAVIDAGGVGYKMTISQNTFSALPKLGENAKLYTWLSVREDGVELFGFAKEDELSAFKLLIGVSGVGPKVALGVLSFLTPEKLALAVSSEDSKTLAKANGVGSKTAARIVLELKDKMSATGASDSVGDVVTTGGATSGALADATEALTVLGYSRSDVNAALRGVNLNGMSTEDIIRTAMKQLMR
ncbi:MAG: Holliday junction branch migration protein RuvA [Clostridia bacterium]|nr:Holliday junction branch migration protein RuvA [Clostridia bacterium]